MRKIAISVVSLFCFFISCKVATAGDKIVAKIGDEVITEHALEKRLEKVPPNRREKYRRSVLNHMVTTKVFSKEAEKVKLMNDPEVSAELERSKNEILAKSFINRFIDEKIVFSDQELEDYYNLHEKEFIVPESILVSHILVPSEAQAKEVLKNLKDGALFGELAKKKSICRSWSKGGDLGWLAKGRMDPDFEKAAFALKEGEISNVIKTEAGYHIIKLRGKREAKKISFSEAREKIRWKLFWERRDKIIKQYYDKALVELVNGESKKGEKVMAKIGDEVITEAHVDHKIKSVPPQDRAKYRERMLGHIIEVTVFSREAEKEKMMDDPEVLAELEEARNEILAKAFIKRFIKNKIVITDKEIEELYNVHKQEFESKRIRAYHILVKEKEEAEEILKRLKEGASFEQLAKEKSICTSGLKGGDLGWLGKGEMDPDFEKAAFALKKGELSDIVKTKLGYHIILLVNKRGGEGSISEVNKILRSRLVAQKARKLKQKYYEKARVEILLKDKKNE